MIGTPSWVAPYFGWEGGCIYICFNQANIHIYIYIYIFIYVDGIIIVSSSFLATGHLLQQLQVEFR